MPPDSRRAAPELGVVLGVHHARAAAPTRRRRSSAAPSPSARPPRGPRPAPGCRGDLAPHHVAEQRRVGVEPQRLAAGRRRRPARACPRPHLAMKCQKLIAPAVSPSSAALKISGGAPKTCSVSAARSKPLLGIGAQDQPALVHRPAGDADLLAPQVRQRLAPGCPP